MNLFQDKKTALITGGSGGIGMAIARRMKEENIKTAITDIEDAETGFPFFKCDIRKGEDIDKLFHWYSENFGIPDILILNAGKGIKEKLYEGDPEKWQEVLDINLMGMLRCIRAFVPQMQERKSGRIIIISSVAVSQPHPYGGIYSASKAAVEMIAKTLRLETFPFLHVTLLRFGAVRTDFFKNQKAGDPDYADKHPVMNPEEIADDVFYIITRDKDRVINQMVSRPLTQKF